MVRFPLVAFPFSFYIRARKQVGEVTEPSVTSRSAALCVTIGVSLCQNGDQIGPRFTFPDGQVGTKLDTDVASACPEGQRYGEGDI